MDASGYICSNCRTSIHGDIEENAACPFCGAVFSNWEEVIINNYNGVNEQ